MFLDELGLKESGLDRLITAGYDLLGLISYLTAGKPCLLYTSNCTVSSAKGKASNF